MPTVYTEQVWRALYSVPAPEIDGVPVRLPLTYSRQYEFFDHWDFDTGNPRLRGEARRHSARRQGLTAGGFLNNTRVLCVGAAFGFLMEELLDFGITDVWGIEPSPYVWANTSEMRPDVQPRIVNATVGVDSTSLVQGLLSAAGMTNPLRADWIVDEDAISSMNNDAEIHAFLDGCEGLLQGNARSRIVHLVTPATQPGMVGDSALLWKTLDEWSAYRPDHTWIDARRGVFNLA